MCLVVLLLVLSYLFVCGFDLFVWLIVLLVYVIFCCMILFIIYLLGSLLC